MKSIKFIVLLSLIVFFSSNSFGQLKVTSTGDVQVTKGLQYGSGSFYSANDFKIHPTGLTYPTFFLKATNGYIGLLKGPNAPSYALDVSGSIRVNSTIYSSDAKLKKDIKDISSESASKIYKLKVKSYKYDNENAFFSSDDPTLLREHFGLLAQDLQDVYPELVYEDNEGVLGIDYVGLIPILVQTVQEQQKLIEDLSATLSQMNEKSASEIEEMTGTASISQNVPNPFYETTIINAFIPETVVNANLAIYNMNGTILENIEITDRNSCSVTINGSELSAGLYYYTLVVDGQLVDTRNMILTE